MSEKTPPTNEPRLENLIQDLQEKIRTVMTSEDQYTKALLLAALSHFGQRDKAGASYVRHPIRVSENLKGNEKERSAALMHDVLEDTEFTEEDLKALGFSQYVIDTVKSLTKDESLNYEGNILRILRSPSEASRKIKVQDILDNLRLSRLKNRFQLKEKDLGRIQNYIDALNVLGYRE